MKKKELTLRDIAGRLDGELTGGHEDMVVSNVAGLKEAGPGDISFLAHHRFTKDLHETSASAVVLPRNISFNRLPAIRVENPYFAFSRLLHLFYDRPYKPGGIDEKAVIGRDVRIGKDATIYPWVYIENRAIIGDNVTIYPFTFIGEGSTIGDDVVIYPNVTVREKTSLGHRVIIHCGAVIGSDGFGYVPHNGINHKIPQVGGVIIEDDVEIGANTTIDRATVGNTIIRRGTKIDNLVQIAHNVTVGEDCLFAAQVGIAGSSRLGNRVTLAGQAGVTGHINIGNNATVAGQGGATKDIKDGQTVSGMPAMPHREWLKSMAIFNNLPEMKRRISELEDKLAAIENRIKGSV